jgi:DNA repair protein RecO (recombination protein O)
MALHTTDAYVLRTYSLAEADKICVFLSKESGKIRGVAHGARKMKSRFGSALEPFTEVSLTFFHKEGRELVSISGCEILRSHFYSAARDVQTAGAFSYMAEMLVEFLPENEPNERLYRLVSATLQSIEEGGDLSRLLRYFETWLLRLMGFFPDTSQCSVCGERPADTDSLFLSGEGAPRCMTCSGGRGFEVDLELRRIIREILRLHPTQFARKRFAAERLSQLAQINYHIVRHVLERDLRSRSLLNEMLSA